MTAASDVEGALAVALVQLVRRIFLVLLVWSAFWAGRMVEQRSQLGRMLVLAPALEDLREATRSADSLGMLLLIKSGRDARPTRLH